MYTGNVYFKVNIQLYSQLYPFIVGKFVTVNSEYPRPPMKKANNLNNETYE